MKDPRSCYCVVHHLRSQYAVRTEGSMDANATRMCNKSAGDAIQQNGDTTFVNNAPLLPQIKYNTYLKTTQISYKIYQCF